MFESFSQRLQGVLSSLGRRGVLRREDIEAGLREIRVALLEADVALEVVRELQEQIAGEAEGQQVLRSVSPGQQIARIVHDALVRIMTADEAAGLELSGSGVRTVMLAGLQGSGKTTTAARLARLWQHGRGMDVLLASVDVYRPAAREQLRVLGDQAGVRVLPVVESELPCVTLRRAQEAARLAGCRIVLLDTAGRTHLDGAMMDELSELSRAAGGRGQCLLVADAMTGQEAVRLARAFQERIALSGLVLTRVDGDSRGGAAVSMARVTGCPVLYCGVGEKIDQIEPFDARQMADRILGMGDIQALVSRAQESVDEEEADRLMRRIGKGRFDFNDMASQLTQLQKMGGLAPVLSMLPGMGGMMKAAAARGMDDRAISRQVAIIRSMTLQERRQPAMILASRRRRIARGAGVGVHEVNRLLKQQETMAKMLRKLGKSGGKGLPGADMLNSLVTRGSQRR